MTRRLKSLITPILITCFVLAAAMHVTRSLPLYALGAPGFSARAHRLINRVALEVPDAPADIRPPRAPAGAFIRSDFNPAPATAPRREYLFLPLGQFWTGRILRRIASAEPDGH